MTATETTIASAIALTGSWRNTNPAPKLIRQAVFAADGEKFKVRIECSGAFGSPGSGEAQAFAFSEDPNSSAATAFNAEFSTDQFSTVIQAYVVKGVLVIISMNRFREGTAARGVFIKEFFYREKAV
jgi:hypothetical protein